MILTNLLNLKKTHFILLFSNTKQWTQQIEEKYNFKIKALKFIHQDFYKDIGPYFFVLFYEYFCLQIKKLIKKLCLLFF